MPGSAKACASDTENSSCSVDACSAAPAVAGLPPWPRPLAPRSPYATSTPPIFQLPPAPQWPRSVPISRDSSSMADTVVTRFAPSPTGYLHIGGARTALFNWLYARHTGGKILLRIEDTDRERSTEAAIAGDPRRAELARARLGRRAGLSVRPRRAAPRGRRASSLRAGKAYYCYATPEELDAMRETARAEGAAALRRPLARPRPVRGAGRRAPRHPHQGAATRARRSSTTACRAGSRFPNKDLDDLILLRSDGTPTYMLAVVVDDHDMGVTHIIRGDDHLTNAARQTLIYQAHGLARAGDGAHPADPRAGRRQALQAPRRAGRRGLPRHGLPARGAAQLSGAARLEPWRRRDHSPSTT